MLLYFCSVKHYSKVWQMCHVLDLGDLALGREKIIV